MDKVLHFFDYQQCFEYYSNRIMNIRQAKMRGERIVAKPVLLVAIIDAIEKDVFTTNRVVLNDWLEGRYKMLMAQYARPSQFDELTEIDKPFWHLETDGFWHLKYPGERLGKGRTPTKKWLKEKVEYGCFDQELWILLQSREWRLELRKYIIEQKLIDDGWLGRLAAEGLGALASCSSPAESFHAPPV